MGRIDDEFEEWVIQGHREQMARELANIIQLRRYTSPVSRQYYFGRSRGYVNGGLFQSHRVVEENPSPVDLDVVDLSSIAAIDEKRLVVSAILSRATQDAISSWRMVMEGGTDTRVPLFIVVDEAHNLMPSGDCDGATAILREQFRTIAAEGRKYGLFLIIVSQRPDKLDSLVVSECENRIMMRIGSESVLEKSTELLGLEDIPPKVLGKCLEFTTGRGLIAGSWVDSPEFFYAAARRTTEGGRDIGDLWLRPRVGPDEPAAKKRKRNSKKQPTTSKRATTTKKRRAAT